LNPNAVTLKKKQLQLSSCFFVLHF